MRANMPVLRVDDGLAIPWLFLTSSMDWQLTNYTHG